MNEEEYREFRRKAVSSVCRSVIRDPPTDDGDEAAAEGSAGEGRDAGGSEVVVSLHPAVRAHLEAEFEDRFGGYEPQDVAAVVPTESGDPDTAATVPLDRDEGDGPEQGDLLAYRTVRADLLAAAAEHADALGDAIEVHDTLERLVGERGPPSDRRPSEVVASFLAWIAEERGEMAAEALQGEFTVLHVMRIAPLYRCDEDDPGLVETVREWLADAHPETLERRAVTVQR
ncbi:hypothetical protein BRD00_14365 [Halobacteriales archaeon QS_8_69_26]|nr:MAG: hypothetical protein BRD00_14365 [Halobacteriales archaeon QS_8_69_26]